MKKVLIFHSPLPENAPADELDVLHEAAFMQLGLKELGYETEILPFPYDLHTIERILRKHDPVFVVNLVETLFSSGRLVHFAPFLFEHFKVPYTGCPASAMYTTSDKILSKKLMKLAGIPTPEFLTWEALQNHVSRLEKFFLVKSIWEHASFGMDENRKLLFDQTHELAQQMRATGNPVSFFAEQYIHGREFNISVLDTSSGPQVLPVAEMQFHYPEEKARIVGYRAKWDEDSFEYKHTIRSFDFNAEDQPLLSALKELCLKCWNLFGLKGYARVDFRVDQQGNIFVLEINANPCISADSGFVAAACHFGLSPAQIMAHIADTLSQ